LVVVVDLDNLFLVQFVVDFVDYQMVDNSNFVHLVDQEVYSGLVANHVEEGIVVVQVEDSLDLVAVVVVVLDSGVDEMEDSLEVVDFVLVDNY
jgi:hypothetical protein